jgi:hypothetical protein
MFPKLRTKNEKPNSKRIRKSGKSRKSRDTGSESNSSSLEPEKHANRGTQCRDTQECYRCHKVGHSAP